MVGRSCLPRGAASVSDVLPGVECPHRRGRVGRRSSDSATVDAGVLVSVNTDDPVGRRPRPSLCAFRASGARFWLPLGRSGR